MVVYYLLELLSDSQSTALLAYVSYQIFMAEKKIFLDLVSVIIMICSDIFSFLFHMFNYFLKLGYSLPNAQFKEGIFFAHLGKYCYFQGRRLGGHWQLRGSYDQLCTSETYQEEEPFFFFWWGSKVFLHHQRLKPNTLVHTVSQGRNGGYFHTGYLPV